MGALDDAAKRYYARTAEETPDEQSSNSRDSRDGNQESAKVRGWGQPSALPSMPDVPRFPLEAFPSKVAAYWHAAGGALACPIDYVAVPGLSLLGAAIGRSRAASVKEGWAESPCIWTAFFAPPGSTKSAALKHAAAPLYRAEAEWLDRHREKVSIFDTEMDRHNLAMKDWKANGCNGEPPSKPARPTLRQALLDDTTVEAAAKVLADNERGICVVKDELIGFIRSLNQYKSGGKGADREFWLSSWAGARAKVNRAKDHDAGPLIIPTPFAGIAGAMCPDALPELRGDNRRGESLSDGFLDRFLLSFPDPYEAVAETWKTIPDNATRDYCEVVTQLLAFELVPVTEGLTVERYRPYYIPFSDAGRAAWEEFTGGIADRMNALDSFDPHRGVLSKLRGYALRFAALLHSLKRVCGELEANDHINSEIIANASLIVDYFDRHANRCMGRGWADRSVRIATRLIAWLERNPMRIGFSRTEAFLALKDRRDVRSAEALAPAFKMLVDHNYIRQIDPERKSGPAAEFYMVNPEWERAHTYETRP